MLPSKLPARDTYAKVKASAGLSTLSWKWAMFSLALAGAIMLARKRGALAL
jgi:hypothetical protein